MNKLFNKKKNKKFQKFLKKKLNNKKKSLLNFNINPLCTIKCISLLLPDVCLTTNSLTKNLNSKNLYKTFSKISPKKKDKNNNRKNNLEKADVPIKEDNSKKKELNLLKKLLTKKLMLKLTISPLKLPKF